MDNPASSPNQLASDDHALIQAVDGAYSAKAKSGADATYSNKVARAFGYTLEQLQSIPAESHMGLSCGNPVAAASIKEGENVLDLGSGGGMDILLAAASIGPGGQAIGLDMSSDMISLARRNALKKGLKPPHVSFVQVSLAEPLPISSNCIDCILSNCVINLLPLAGKANLLTETHRVLKPGGRIVLDDIVAKGPLPESIRNNLAAYVGCISGAIELEIYEEMLYNAGFQDVVFVDTRGDINVYFKDESTFAGCCTPDLNLTIAASTSPNSDTPAGNTSCCAPDSSTTAQSKACSPADPAWVTDSTNQLQIFDANTWVASYQIYAIKSSDLATDPTATAAAPLLHWWDAYPTPKSSAATMTTEELSDLIRDPTRRDEYAVIDLRKTDREGGHIRGSFQYPAEEFYHGLIRFAEKFRGVKQVVFYCGGSKGRAPRCAGWYQDYLNEDDHSASKAYILQGGIAAWLSKFRNYTELVDSD